MALRSTVQRQAHRWTIDGTFQTPPDWSSFNDVGGVRNGVPFLADPPLYVVGIHCSIHVPHTTYHFLMYPPSPHDIILHIFPPRVTSHYSVSPFPLFTHYKSLHHGHFPINTCHITRSYSSFIVTCHLMLQKDPLAIYYCPSDLSPTPNGYPFAQNYSFRSFLPFLTLSMHQRYFPCLLSVLVSLPKPQSSPLTFCLTCRYFHSDGAKIQESRIRGKSFPPTSY
jgi:hypothetical protein